MLNLRKWVQGKREARPSPLPQEKRGIFYGWWVVAAGSLVNALGVVHFKGFSVLFLPLTRDLQLSRTRISLAFSLSRGEGALEGPVAGYLIDRWGARTMLIAGAILSGVGYILFSRVNSFLAFLLVYGGVVTVGSNTGFSQALMAAVNNWFVRRRGLAMAILASAGTLGAAFLIPVLSLAVHSLGWRQAVVLVGISLLAIVTPVSWLVRRSPESMGLLPDGDRPHPAAGSHPVPTALPAPVDYKLREALSTSAYWYLSLATMLRVGVISSITVHFIPIMVWKGMEEQSASILLGVFSLVTIPFRILLGWLGDRWLKKYLIALALVAGMASLFLLLSSPSQGRLWLFIPLLAAAEAAGPLNWAMVGDFFGRRSFATLRGVMSFFYTWGMVMLPVVAGAIYDRTQSYALALWIFLVVMGVAAVAFAWLRPPRHPDMAPWAEKSG